MYQLQPHVKWHEASWAKAMACTKPWIVGVRVDPGYSCIIERLEILGDSGVFFCEEILFSKFWKPKCYTTEIWKTRFYWALTTIFFCICFIFPWFPRRGVAEPWGGPDRRELLGELVWCSGVDVPICCYLHIWTTFLPTCLLIFDVTVFPLHKVFWGRKTPWIQWFNRSCSPLG